jgi:hypothetical protein
MRTLRSGLIFAAACIVASAATAAGQQQRARRTAALQKVQKIYVGDMGEAFEADRFRLMLEEQLLKRGFDVARKAEDADASLTGVLDVRYYDYNYAASATVRLVSDAEEVLWAKDFAEDGYAAMNPFNRKEPLRRRAEEVAEALKREIKKPAKRGP